MFFSSAIAVGLTEQTILMMVKVTVQLKGSDVRNGSDK